jgi:integrase
MVRYRSAEGYAHVERAKVMGEIKPTKTYQMRDIELKSRVLAALNRQKKAYTYLAGADVFIDPITGRSYVGDKSPRLVWDVALKALGIRHGNAYHES